MIDERALVRKNLRVMRWNFEIAIEEAYAGNTKNLEAFFDNEDWNPSRRQREAIKELLYRKVHKGRRSEVLGSGPKGGRARRGNQDHAEIVVFARSKRTIDALRAEATNHQVDATTKKRIVIRHKARLVAELHPHAWTVKVKNVLGRLDRYESIPSGF